MGCKARFTYLKQYATKRQIKKTDLKKTIKNRSFNTYRLKNFYQILKFINTIKHYIKP